MQEHWFKTQRRASSVFQWAMDMSQNGFPTEEDNPLYFEGCRGALFDITTKARELADREDWFTDRGDYSPYMKMTWWLEPEKRYEAQEGHSDAYREGYLAVIDKCVEYCHTVLDGDMYSLRLKTLQDHVNYLTALIDWDTRWIEVGYSKQVEKLVEAEDFIHASSLKLKRDGLKASIGKKQQLLESARKQLEQFKRESQTEEFRKENADIDGKCRFVNPYTNLRCDRKTVNGTRWCEDHKDEWCDECGRHATRVRNDYLGKKITPRLCDQCKEYTGE